MRPRRASRREFLGAVAVAPLLGVACHREPVARVLRVAFPSPPVSLDPHVTNETVSFAVNANLYDALVATDPTQRIEPQLASRWLTPDDLTWVFELRQDRRFHDGRPVTARDVAWSLARQRDDPRSEWRDGLVDVSAVEVQDARVVLRTRFALATLVSRLQGSFVAPAGSLALESRPVGSGPYRLGKRTATEIELLGVPGDARSAAIGELRFQVLPGAATRVDAVLRGAIDLATDIPPDALPGLRVAPGIRVLQARALRQLFLGFDHSGLTTPHVELPRNPFRDRRVRRAVQQALDVPAIVREVFADAAEPATWIAAPGVAGFDPDRPPPAFSPERARSLLAEAGLPQGFRVRLHTSSGVYPGDTRVAATVARHLREVGIEASVEAEEKAVFFDRLGRRDTSLYLMSWNCLSGDAQEVLDYLFHTPDRERGYGSENAGGYSNPAFDRAAEEASATMAARRRMERLKEAAHLLLDDVAMVPLVVYRQVYALREPFVWAPRGDRKVRGEDVTVSGPAAG